MLPKITSRWDYSLLQIWMQKSIWRRLISCRSVAEPCALSLSHKRACASLLNSLLLTVPMAKPTTATNANTTCGSRLKRGILNPSLSGESPDSLLSADVEDEIQHHWDSSASLCWQIPPHRSVKPCQHIWETRISPRSTGAELRWCWQTLACSFHAFQRSVIVFDVPEKHRMILTLCYPFFTTELGLRSHTSVRNRNLKLPLSTYCISRYRVSLPCWFTHSSNSWRVFFPHNSKLRNQFLMKGEIQNTARWPCIHQVGHVWLTSLAPLF